MRYLYKSLSQRCYNRVKGFTVNSVVEASAQWRLWGFKDLESFRLGCKRTDGSVKTNLGKHRSVASIGLWQQTNMDIYWVTKELLS